MTDPTEPNAEHDQPDAEVWAIPKEAFAKLASGPSWPANRMPDLWAEEAR
ncbi:MAG: hypothetical protein ACRC20_07165 [Segniliparus sp.]